MKLTGKCATDFYLWIITNDLSQNPHLEYWFNIQINDIYRNALIIEFFDSVGIYVNAIRYNGKWKPLCDYELQEIFNTRAKATNAAITKANEIFNLNNK